MFRRKKRCQHRCPSAHPAYRGRQCEREPDHDGMCRIAVGLYKHYWRQEFYDRVRRPYDGPSA